MNFIINGKRCVNFASYALIDLIMNCQNVATTLFLPNMVLLSLASCISPYTPSRRLRRLDKLRRAKLKVAVESPATGSPYATRTRLSYYALAITSTERRRVNSWIFCWVYILTFLDNRSIFLHGTFAERKFKDSRMGEAKQYFRTPSSCNMTGPYVWPIYGRCEKWSCKQSPNSSSQRQLYAGIENWWV